VNLADRQVPLPVDDGAGRAGVRVVAGRARAAGFRAAGFLALPPLAAFCAAVVSAAGVAARTTARTALGVVVAFGRLARLRRAGVGMKAFIRAEGSFEVRLLGTVLLSASCVRLQACCARK
jgi:hypothetical protein